MPMASATPSARDEYAAFNAGEGVGTCVSDSPASDGSASQSMAVPQVESLGWIAGSRARLELGCAHPATIAHARTGKASTVHGRVGLPIGRECTHKRDGESFPRPHTSAADLFPFPAAGPPRNSPSSADAAGDMAIG